MFPTSLCGADEGERSLSCSCESSVENSSTTVNFMQHCVHGAVHLRHARRDPRKTEHVALFTTSPVNAVNAVFRGSHKTTAHPTRYLPATEVQV